MNEYKTPYFVLFNGITDIVRSMEQVVLSSGDAQKHNEYEAFIIALRKLQQESEDKFIDSQS